MNKKASRRFRRFGIFLLIVPIGLWSFVKDDNYFEISKNLEIFTSIYKELNIFYVDDTKPGELMTTGINSMLKSLDPYTIYFPESRIEEARFAQTGKYGDMISMGIIDPVKVVRHALQDAASVASLLITTEAMVAEAPKKDAPAAPAMPDMGGMGGMM